MAEKDSKRNRRDGEGAGFTRRKVIERGAVGAAGLLGVNFLAACGSSSSTTSKSAAASAAEAAAGASRSAPSRTTRWLRSATRSSSGSPMRPGSRSSTTRPATTPGIRTPRTTGSTRPARTTSMSWTTTGCRSSPPARSSRTSTRSASRPIPDILPKGLDQGYWPPKTGARLKDFKNAKPALYAVVIIDDVEILYYRKDLFTGVPKTWDDIAKVAKAKTKPPNMYGWSARGVKGNPIMMTYLPLLNSYGGQFVNDDWSPGFAGPEGVGALERLMSFIPYMPDGVAEFDTDQETQVMLEGKCTALTEYTGLVHQVDNKSASKVVRKDRHGGHADSGEERARRSARSSAGSPPERRTPPAPCTSSSGSPRARSKPISPVLAEAPRSPSPRWRILRRPSSTAGCPRSRTRSTTRCPSPRPRTSRSSRTSSARTSTRLWCRRFSARAATAPSPSRS